VSAPTLGLRRLGIDTYTDPVVFMRRDCHVCRAEGLEARSRVRVTLGGRSIIATLNVVSDALLARDEAGLSEHAWRLLEAREGARAAFSHPEPAASESRLRAKVYGARLDAADMRAIIGDVVSGNYSDLHLAAFVTAGAGDRLDEAETVALTRAMVGAGERMRWDYPLVADKHCVGGLPGNRTTPLVVAIVAACGVPIPKTSSRAITSPAGTADTMEVLAPVALDVPAMRKVVERDSGRSVFVASQGHDTHVLIHGGIAARLDDASRAIPALDLVLKEHQSVEDSLGPGGTSGHVNIKGDDLVGPGNARVVVVKATASGASAKGQDKLRSHHLLVDPLEHWGLPLSDGSHHPEKVALSR